MKKTEVKIVIESDDSDLPTAVSVQANAVTTATMLLAVTRLLETLQEHLKKDDNRNLSDVIATLLASAFEQLKEQNNDKRRIG